MHFLVKVIVSALIIGIITEVAKHYSTIGGFIAALPLVSLLSLFWISFEGGNKQELSQFTLGVLYGFPASALLLFIVYISLKNSFALSTSVLLGIGAWCIVFACQKLFQT
ncbi:membrane protein [Bacillus thuringiensis MC28]|nr:membrane protein [Bacillus thuringiensis MC28]